MARPEGVTVLALLFVIGGLFFLISAAFAGLISATTGGIAVFLVLIAFISFGIAYGLWHGRDWARIIAMILAVIGLMVSLIYLFSLALMPMGVIGIIIETVVIYYLTRPHVKDFFEKAGHATSLPQSPMRHTWNEYPAIRCPNCGHENPSNFNYCGKCGTPIAEEETKIY